MRFLLVIALAVAIVSCTKREPASVGKSAFLGANRKPSSSDDLIEGPRILLQEVRNPSIFNAGECAAYVHGWTDKLFGLPIKHFIPTTPEEAGRLKAEGPHVLQTLFALRLATRERLREFEAAGTATGECIDAVRESFRYVRFAEELLLDWLQGQGVYDRQKPAHFEGGAPHTMVNPAFGSVEPKAGDVMIVRGKSYVSAMIARIGNEEAQFSHLAIVGMDAKGRLHVVESLIQTGVIVTPIARWMSDRDARVVMYRHPDAALAKKAARLIYDHAEPRFRAKNNIRYDFAMDDADDGSFFCSEVAAYAYKKASQGKVVLPLHRSSVTKFRGTGYVEALGLKRDSIFAPGDMEVDTRFEMVGEYRHWPLLRQVRMQDAVLSSVYGWMIEKGYRFRGDAWLSGKAFLGKFLRQFGLLADKMPKYMPLKTVRVTLQFEAASNALQDDLYAKEALYHQRNGHSLSFREMLKITEDLRRKDCEAWVRRNGSLRPGEPPRDQVLFSSFFNNGKNCD